MPGKLTSVLSLTGGGGGNNADKDEKLKEERAKTEAERRKNGERAFCTHWQYINS